MRALNHLGPFHLKGTATTCGVYKVVYKAYNALYYGETEFYLMVEPDGRSPDDDALFREQVAKVGRPHWYTFYGYDHDPVRTLTHMYPDGTFLRRPL